MTTVRLIVLDGFDWRWTLRERDGSAAALFAHVAGVHGCYGALRAMTPPLTPPGVGALLTGRALPLSWGGQTDQYTTALALIRQKPWISHLTRYGFTVGLCNIPITWPAFAVPRGCWMVSGFPVDPVALKDQGRGWRWPYGLDVEGYPIEGIIEDTGPGGTTNLQGLMDTEDAIADWFLNRAPRCDLEIVWTRSTDSAGHHAWGTSEYDRVCRAAIDRAIRLTVGSGTWVIVSDHGFDALSSPRCAAYMGTTHGLVATSIGLPGGHAEEGILFAGGDRIHVEGQIPEQRFLHLASGIFDLLRVPPASGMDVGNPEWTQALGPEEEKRMREMLSKLGYVP